MVHPERQKLLTELHARYIVAFSEVGRTGCLLLLRAACVGVGESEER